MFIILEIIDNYESLNIMNSVLSILNLLLENLNFNFGDLASQLRVIKIIFEFSCVIKINTFFLLKKQSKQISQIKYIESLFLADFPYMLAENFEYTSEAKKVNQQVCLAFRKSFSMI